MVATKRPSKNGFKTNKNNKKRRLTSPAAIRSTPNTEKCKCINLKEQIDSLIVGQRMILENQSNLLTLLSKNQTHLLTLVSKNQSHLLTLVSKL